ncbi:hypothetical protein [Caballeronia sp. RCC_10]|uniref:hypothetical protein n=1 Tax=Caballeronia sp. RCC_10 TaxID=3239227 RepID=UPI003523A9A4
MTRFINLRAEAIPDWLADSVRSALDALGYQAVGVESIIDGSLLATFSACWFFAAVMLCTSLLLTGQFLRRRLSLLACAVAMFAAAYSVAYQLHEAVTAPGGPRWLHDRLTTPFGGESNSLQTVYLLILFITCWLGVLLAVLAVRAAMCRYRASSCRDVGHS